MPPATKTLSPAELAKLEHAFATDPASEAYKPLAEAYLGMGRFMEAMVVCKKGVKAHPSVADPRVLLARVYAEQGKDKKAIEELQGALQVAPSDKSALRLMGALQIKGGEPNTGKETLLKAFNLDPADGETIEVMNKNGVPVPAPKAPEPPPPPPQPVAPPPSQHVGATATSAVQQPVQPSVVVGNGGPNIEVQAAPPVSVAPAQPSQPAQRTSRPAPRPPPQQQRRSRYEESEASQTGEHSYSESSISGISEVSDVRSSRKKGSSGKSSSSRALFFLLVFAVPVAAAAYFGIGQWRAKKIREANAAIRDATTLIKSDTFKGYEEGIKKAEFALDLDGDSVTNRNARGLVAFAYTIRWGEHIHDDSNRENAEKNIKTGVAKNEQSAYLHAAEAMFAFYDGKTDEGLKMIGDRIAAAEAEKKNVSIYYLTRGILQTNNGDLEGAKESLERAQSIAPDDPRVYVALGNLHRRRGSDMQALSAFNNALKYTRNSHPEGLLGTANLILDQENPGNGYCTAAKYVKTLGEMTDSAAPRQLATNSFVKALLISRVSRDIPAYTDKAFQKQLEDCTGVKADEAQAKKDIATAENEGLSQDRNNAELLLIRGRRLGWEAGSDPKSPKLDEAAAEIKKAIDMNPKASHFYVELAKVLSRKEGGEAAAEKALIDALKMVPASPKLLSMLGQAQYKQKKFDDARQTLEKAVSDPKTKNPEARFLLGKIYRDDKKDYAKSIENLKRAGEEYYSDPAMAGAAYDELGAAYEAKGEKDGASTSYEKALNADKDNPAPYCHYARLLSKDPKEKDKAKTLAQAFQKMVAKDAKDPCVDDMNRIAGSGGGSQ
ncbi:MAG: tetratricopeptide repeat protein [Myxococcaceae bacterium]